MNASLTKSTHKNNFTFGLHPPEYSSPSSQEQKYGCKKNGSIVIIPWDVTSASKILYLQAFLNQSLCIQSISIICPRTSWTILAQPLLALPQSTVRLLSYCYYRRQRAKLDFHGFTHTEQKKQEARGGTVETQPTCMDVNQTGRVILATLFHVLWTFRTYFGILLLHFYVVRNLAGEERGNNSHFAVRLGWVLWFQVKPEQKEEIPRSCNPCTSDITANFYPNQSQNKTIQTWWKRMRAPSVQPVLGRRGSRRGTIPTPAALSLDPCVVRNCGCHLI